MNYLEELKNRSEILWRSLFGEERSAGEDAPVYIDGAAAAFDKAAAARQKTQDTAERERVSSAEETPQLPGAAAERVLPAAQREETAAKEEAPPQPPQEAVLQGVAEDAVARLLERTAESETGVRREVAAALAEQPAGQGAPEQENAAEHAEAAALPPPPAARLLEQVRQAERSTAALSRRAPLPDGAQTAPAADPGMASPADWSLCFEKDARRYDGAYELL